MYCACVELAHPRSSAVEYTLKAVRPDAQIKVYPGLKGPYTKLNNQLNCVMSFGGADAGRQALACQVASALTLSCNLPMLRVSDPESPILRGLVLTMGIGPFSRR